MVEYETILKSDGYLMDNASKALCVGTLLMLDCMCLCCLRLRSLRGKLESVGEQSKESLSLHAQAERPL